MASKEIILGTKYRIYLKFSLHTYQHFCSAFQLYDVAINYFKYNSSWGDYQQEDNLDNLPKWVIKASHVELAKMIKKEWAVRSDSNKKVLMAQYHTGDTTNWGYFYNMHKLKAFYDGVLSNTMVVYEAQKKGGQGLIQLSECVIPIGNIKKMARRRYTILKTQQEPEQPEQPDEPERLTGEQVLEYLNNME